MIVSIHQPQYLPWVPYFAKAACCDVFVYLDTVDFQRRGVQNRNRIKTSQGAQLLTVPVNATRGQAIREIRIAEERWKRKHILSIERNYANAPFLELFDRGLRPILQRSDQYLVELNVAATEWLFGHLGIACHRIRASELGATGTKGDLMISICKELGATVYFSGQGARDYQDEQKFRAEGVELRYQEYQAQPYPQCHPETGFISDLSAVDLVLNAGPRAREIMLAGVCAR